MLLWNLVTTFVKKSAPKFSAWLQLFKFLYQFTFWIVLIFLIFFLFLSLNLIFAFWNATWWHFKIFHKNLNLRFLFNNLSHWWKSKQFARFRNWLWLVFSCHMYLMLSLYYLYVYGCFRFLSCPTDFARLPTDFVNFAFHEWKFIIFHQIFNESFNVF